MPGKVTSRLAKSFLPSTAVLEMTYRCNHQCIFCSCPWEDPASGFEVLPELSANEWKDVIDQLCAMGICSIAFTGGEPLLKEGLFDIIAYAGTRLPEHITTTDGSLESRNAPPRLYLLSNGTAVDASVLKFCKEHDVHLSMSLPGLSTYRAHTRCGNPDTILANFEAARAMGVATVVNSTVTHKNLHELYHTLGAAFLAGAGQLLMNRFLPGGRGVRYAQGLQMTRDEVVTMLDTAEQALTDAGRYGNVGTELPKCVLEPARYERLTVGTRCSAALGFFVVDPSGYVRACNHSPIRLHHVNQIEKVKTDPYWMTFTQKKYLPNSCLRCEHTGSCDGGCREAAHIAGGHVTSPDPLFVCA